MITSTLAFYPCRDLAATEKFYAGLIGLEVAYSSESVRIFSSPKGHIGFVDYGDGAMAGPHVCISFNCPSEQAVEQSYQRILAAGGAPKGPPARHPKQPVYSFFLEDPNGYTVEFEKLCGIDL